VSRRAVITGAGPVSAIGTGRAAFTEALLAGRSGQRGIGAFDTAGYRIRHGCEVPDFVPAQWTDRPGELGRSAAFAVAAARLALADAGLEPEALRHESVLIAIGISDCDAVEEDRLAAQLAAGGPAAFEPATAARYTAACSTRTAAELGLETAETVDIAAACAAGNHAIAHGLDAIRLGDADLVLCGGAEAFGRRMFTGFHRVGTLASEACRPFDADRDGTVTGEGAGIIVLEEYEHALARGARVLGELLGAAVNCDAHHPVAPSRDAVAECIRLAHTDAGLQPSAVDAVSAHGTGTPANDVNEAGAVRQVFGDAIPPFTAAKSMLGHAMGASSALGAIASLAALDAQRLPPTVNHRRTDPECAVDCVPNESRPADLRVVENHGFGFGGTNAVILIGRP
jgi:3-oxoacyl-[acyl-carrier-protein] synthase II